MKCPFCFDEETKVVDKRDIDLCSRRRRECLKCSKRFTTYERVESVDMIVIKKSGEKERFDRAKLKRGLLIPTEKRPIPEEKIEEIMDRIEMDLRSMDTKEMESKKIGSLVMKYLKRLDKIAYVRFASVYKDFEDLEDFSQEVEKLRK